jgi:hypothetical protein
MTTPVSLLFESVKEHDADYAAACSAAGIVLSNEEYTKWVKDARDAGYRDVRHWLEGTSKKED